MRRLSLGFIALVVVVLAMPASARTFRTDAQDCFDQFATTCWEQIPVPFGSPAGAVPVLPIGQSTYGLISDALSGMVFYTPNFSIKAFDFQAFLTAEGESSSLVDVKAYAGLTRSTAGTPWTGTETPLLRIDWRFDFAQLGAYTDVFEPFPTDFPSSVGVQLLFGLTPGDGFQLNGLALGGYKYAFSSDRLGTPIWSGAEEPCDTFANDGTCIGLSSVPEPSSIALLGLGFLALFAGMRGKPARARLA